MFPDQPQNDITLMSRKSWILFFLLISGCSIAFANCTSQEKQNFDVPKLPNIKLVATTCATSDRNGTINIDVMDSGKLIQMLKATFETSAYSLNVDTEFDIDLDGIPDLAVNTGKGRGGEGMHYWRFDTSKTRYIDLGEAPSLNHDQRNLKNVLFALVSSSGEFDSVRYNYELNNQKLEIVSAIGFKLKNNSDNFEITHLIPNGQDNFRKIGHKLVVNKNIAEGCMDGTGNCP